ncbi:hypothetical protein M011DRAFT_452312 [Sporormia fimetaria CBS 119925]|uniref:XRCC4 coiled-coil domain-containing protein n=1 Tax=Sporormia fimetaria CBS 119925 TaxID=1340428 RepID=A0A6A6UXS6_9PLEO|nr:hypothetical protein M011DRAFT_452312 [Sporormia fimetaria CBS 119925]
MAARHIIPVPAAAAGSPGFVVEVRQTGSDPLDVRLVGTEGESPYVATIKERNIGTLKNKASDKEWPIILAHILLQKQPRPEDAGVLDGVRVEYSLKGDDARITVRRDVQGIKVTLGQIDLRRDESEEIDPLDWAFTSAQAHNHALEEMVQLTASIEAKKAALEKLNAQLDDFIKTKEEAETAMLQQFMVLLNEKKRKIRDQSRLLAGAKVDKATASAVQSTREETKTRSRKAGPSRSSKRKAKQESPPAEEPDDAQMEIDQSKAEEQDEESGPEAETPDRSETEDEGEDASPAEEVAAQSSRGSSSKGEKQSTESLPPTRELPFAKKAGYQGPTLRSADADADDDETEDEEL